MSGRRKLTDLLVGCVLEECTVNDETVKIVEVYKSFIVIATATKTMFHILLSHQYVFRAIRMYPLGSILFSCAGA